MSAAEGTGPYHRDSSNVCCCSFSPRPPAALSVRWLTSCSRRTAPHRRYATEVPPCCGSCGQELPCVFRNVSQATGPCHWHVDMARRGAGGHGMCTRDRPTMRSFCTMHPCFRRVVPVHGTRSVSCLPRRRIALHSPTLWLTRWHAPAHWQVHRCGQRAARRSQLPGGQARRGASPGAAGTLDILPRQQPTTWPGSRKDILPAGGPHAAVGYPD